MRLIYSVLLLILYQILLPGVVHAATFGASCNVGPVSLSQNLRATQQNDIANFTGVPAGTVFRFTNSYNTGLDGYGIEVTHSGISASPASITLGSDSGDPPSTADFTVSAAGDIQFQLNMVPSDLVDLTQRVQNWTLECRPPEITVSSSESGPVADGGTDAQGTELAGTPKTTTYTVNNTGLVALTLATATSGGASNVTVNSISAPGLTSIPPSGSTTFTVNYTPTIVGPFSFDLSFVNSDGDEGPYNITVSGTAPDIVVPIFSATPANITQTNDSGQTTSVVTFTPPTATDDIDGVLTPVLVSSPTPGLTSGSAFPLGVTTLTYTATDMAGNVTTYVFTVTITALPTGTINFIINSNDDGNYSINSPESALNTTIAVGSGSGTSGAVAVRPGSFPVTFNPPNGIGIERAQCIPDTSTLNADTQSGTVVIVSEESVTCTITTQSTVKETVTQIDQFVDKRSQLIILHQPDLTRRLERLKGSKYNNGGVSGFGLALTNDKIPFAAQIGADNISFSYSMRQSRAAGAPPALTGNIVGVLGAFGITPEENEDDTVAAFQPTSTGTAPVQALSPSRVPTIASFKAPKNDGPAVGTFDIWAEGRISQFDTTNGNGNFGIIFFGTDYLIKPDFLFGLALQADWTRLDGDNSNSRTEGTGILLTPYLTATLLEGLYLDMRAGWGEAKNDITPFGTYTDTFDSERWLVSSALIGTWQYNRLIINPEVRLSYFQETSNDYFDSLNRYIPAIKVQIGTLEFGPTFSQDFKTDNGLIYTPFLTVEGVWTFSQESTAESFTDRTDLIIDGGRARVEAGVDIYNHSGSRVNFSIHYDGIGDNNYELWGADFHYAYTIQ